MAIPAEQSLTHRTEREIFFYKFVLIPLNYWKQQNLVGRHLCTVPYKIVFLLGSTGKKCKTCYFCENLKTMITITSKNRVLWKKIFKDFRL